MYSYLKIPLCIVVSAALTACLSEEPKADLPGQNQTDSLQSAQGFATDSSANKDDSNPDGSLFEDLKNEIAELRKGLSGQEGGVANAGDDNMVVSESGSGVSSDNDSSPTSASVFKTLEVTGSDSNLKEGSFNKVSTATMMSTGTQSALPIHQGGFGSQSRCGLDGDVIKVTNLNNDGPGSLREAVRTKKPRTIVFEVSGIIKLRWPLYIESPYITIAGQTAPKPGIALHHSRVRIHTHDVCMQHIRIRHGDMTYKNYRIKRSTASEADTLIIRGKPDKKVYNVVLDNISVSWSVDENVAIYGNTSDITIRDSIIAEPLKYSLQSKNHAYCMFIKDSIKRVSLIGNVFSQCQRRSPRMDGGSLQYVNNMVYNAGEYAVHVHDRSIDVSMIGNILEFPANKLLRWKDTGPREFFASRSKDTKMYITHNELPEDKRLHKRREQGGDVKLQSSPRVWDGSVNVLDTDEVKKNLVNWVGAFPNDRDSHDERVTTDIKNREGKYINSPSDIGGYGFIDENYHSLQVPENPQDDDDGDGVSNLVEWLQAYTDKVEQ